jgi:hypothetical protein
MRTSGAATDISWGYSRCRGARTGSRGALVPTRAGSERKFPRGNTVTGTNRTYLIDIAHLLLAVDHPRMVPSVF